MDGVDSASIQMQWVKGVTRTYSCYCEKRWGPVATTSQAEPLPPRAATTAITTTESHTLGAGESQQQTHNNVPRHYFAKVQCPPPKASCAADAKAEAMLARDVAAAAGRTGAHDAATSPPVWPPTMAWYVMTVKGSLTPSPPHPPPRLTSRPPRTTTKLTTRQPVVSTPAKRETYPGP